MLPDPRIVEPFLLGLFVGVFGALFIQSIAQKLADHRHKKLMATNKIYRFKHAELMAAQYNADKARGE